MKSKQSAKKQAAKKSVKRTAKKVPKIKLSTLATSAAQKPASKVAPPSTTGASARKPPIGKATGNKKVSEHAAIFYRLSTLLHIVRNIAHFEDQLCTILHEIKTKGAPSRALSRELAAALDDMPSTDYAQELGAVRAVLA